MSRTDKTRPYRVKRAKLLPNALLHWRREFGCGRSCKSCWGRHAKAEDRRARQAGHRAERNWQLDFV